MSERRQEEDYFARIEREKKEKLREKLQEEIAGLAVEEQRRLHHHHCGKCGTLMQTRSFRGIDIEICPSCGAVLLDQGELEVLAGKDNSGVISGIKSLFGG